MRGPGASSGADCGPLGRGRQLEPLLWCYGADRVPQEVWRQEIKSLFSDFEYLLHSERRSSSLSGLVDVLGLWNAVQSGLQLLQLGQQLRGGTRKLLETQTQLGPLYMVVLQRAAEVRGQLGGVDEAGQALDRHQARLEEELVL